MGGKKVVVRVPSCDKCRYIAFQTAAGVPGVSSVSLEKDCVAVTGEEIDSFGLLKSLKKKVGCVELLTVGPVEDPKPPKPPPPPPKPKLPIEPVPCSCQSVPCSCRTVPRLCGKEHAIYVCELCDSKPICIIM